MPSTPSSFVAVSVDGYAGGGIGRARARICPAVTGSFAPAGGAIISMLWNQSRRAGGDVTFDLASIDVGSVAAGLDVPGVREHALTLRPMSRVIELRDRVDDLARRASGRGRTVRLSVVGAGAAGYEIALALHRRLTRRLARAAVALLETEPRILDGYLEHVRRRAERVLRRRGIAVAAGSAVTSVSPDGTRLASGIQARVRAVISAGGSRVAGGWGPGGWTDLTRTRTVPERRPRDAAGNLRAAPSVRIE